MQLHTYSPIEQACQFSTSSETVYPNKSNIKLILLLAVLGITGMLIHYSLKILQPQAQDDNRQT